MACLRLRGTLIARSLQGRSTKRQTRLVRIYQRDKNSMTLFFRSKRSPSKNHKSKILIVDDKEENLFALEELLAPLGAEVVKALSGTDALAILASTPDFALILMDVQMPKLDGFSTAELIRKHPKTRHISIIFVTAIHKDEAYVEKGYELGAIDYVCKPINPKILTTKVKYFLSLDNQNHKLKSLVEQTTQFERGKNLILEYAQEGIIACDENGTVVYLNPASLVTLGETESTLLGKNLLDVLHPEGETYIDWAQSALAEAIANNTVRKHRQLDIVTANQDVRTIKYSFGPYNTTEGSGGVMIFQDITEEIKYQNTLLHVSTHDTLTGHPNRVLFAELLRNEIHRSDRHAKRFSVCFISLDKFKKINDEFGHIVADRLLIKVAERLVNHIRKTDVIARIGGDEFAILFQDVEDGFDIKETAEKLMSTINAPFDCDGRQRYITASIGAVTYPDCGGDAENIIRAGHIAVSLSKQSGGNQWVEFEEEFKNSTADYYSFESELRECINRHETVCYYHPIIDAKTGRLGAMEALVRWPHPEKGLIMPGKIIPVAEESNLIIDLGAQVIDNAFAQLKSWTDAGLWPPTARVTINVSPKQFQQGIIIAQIKAAQEKHQIGLHLIELEITENLLMSDIKSAIQIVKDLRKLGVTIAVDDFGSGYSSLMYLKELPADKIKIDQSFIRGLGSQGKDEVVVKSTIDLCHKLGFSVVAEGVEKREQEAFLRQAGVDFTQGFRYAKPMSEADTLAWLKKRNKILDGIYGKA